MIRTAYMTRNPYYRAGRIIPVYGLYLHSVGVGQPDPWVFIRQFDHPDYDRACVHGFIGANETIITMPCMETPGQAMRAPHAGKTWSNDRYLGFEMTEPQGIRYTGNGAEFVITDKAGATAHAWATIRRAVVLFAQLCRFHGLDPLADGVIVSHAEGSRRGIASAHADPEHLWQGLGMGYTMDQFRKEVAEAVSKLDTGKEELDMTIQEFIDQLTDEQAYTLLQKATRHASTLPEPEWSQKEGGWAAGTAKGITDGTGPERPVKRDEVMAMLGRLGLLD